VSVQLGSRANSQAPQNNALQLTRGASEASGLRRTHHRLVPLAAERECCTRAEVATNGRGVFAVRAE